MPNTVEQNLKLLYSFLESQDAREAWYTAFTSQTNRTPVEHLRHDQLKWWLMGSFSWDRTTEGGNYWNNIDNQWREYLKILKLDK